MTSAGDPAGEREVVDREALFAGLGLNVQNKGALGRILASGNIGYAKERADGRMHAEIHIREDELQWDPSILVVPHGGDIDLDFYNDDTSTHCALVPSNGDSQWVWLPTFTHGKCSVNLDGPGTYWYSSHIGNDEGRGLTGAIVIQGEVPAEAKLDRPPQPRPD